MKNWLGLLVAALPASFAVLGCASADVEPPAPVEASHGDVALPEAWDKKNDPASVDPGFIYDATVLPVTASTKSPPIPSDYWGTYNDSINYRWDGEASESPAEKYERAFKKPGLAKRVSELYGIRKQTTRTVCKKDSECASSNDGSVCAIPRGETSGRCIPTWWGICHGWAPYAYSEPAFGKPVVRNGVTFYAADLEALMSLMYTEGTATKNLSARCNLKNAPTDATGRVVAPECRDMNPGSLHVAVTNLLGLRKAGFVYDHTWDSEVWNQPVRSFTVTNLTNGRLSEVTKEQVVALMGHDTSYKVMLPEFNLVKGDARGFSYTATQDGEVQIVTTGIGDVDLFVGIGYPPDDENNDCYAQSNSASETCSVTVKKGDNLGVRIVGYAPKSLVTAYVGLPAAGGPTYTFNPAATRFFHVLADLKYISEIVPGRTNNLASADKVTRTDKLHYVLEADKNGTILGGEWLGFSRLSHPDFLWYPTQKPVKIAEGAITYAELKAMNDESAGVALLQKPLTVTETVVKDANLTAAGLRFALGADGPQTLAITATAGAKLNMTVSAGTASTIKPLVCNGPTAGTSKSCTVTAPALGASYYVVLTPVSGTTKATLTVQRTTPAGQPAPK